MSDMAVNAFMTNQQLFETKNLVNQANQTRNLEMAEVNQNVKRQIDNVLDKDDFLKLLIVQLTNQDPTEPMKDTEFIAQMAQFSSLEQMVNMSNELALVSSIATRGQAFSMLGKAVTITEGNNTIEGIVEEVSGGDFPQVLVNGIYYDFAAVEAVRNK
jgi:flagellar basal-body rod modification protein FlgD